ncbi:MAG: hypothetical protein EKK48_16795 [Candidatus Melainabacteria bacterium]|nr:MAG: hypothetical protein EKK48_16795 [Candidatus Melainabacteria bacterium]
MSKHHHVEEMKSADAHHSSHHKFLDLFADIKGFPQTQPDLCDSLLLKRGILPAVEIADSSSQERTGKVASNRDLQDAGVVRKHSVEKDGAQTTTVDYGNGVIISTTDGGKPVDIGNCMRITFKNNMAVHILPPNVGKLNGNVEDPSGRIIAKHNADGSYTVDTGKGFFTQHTDGSIRKETAIRTDKPHEKRKFHDFDVLDTETPLGNLRPSA